MRDGDNLAGLRAHWCAGAKISSGSWRRRGRPGCVRRMRAGSRASYKGDEPAPHRQGRLSNNASEQRRLTYRGVERGSGARAKPTRHG